MCSVCNGYPGCPCCGEGELTETCPECNGDGNIFYDTEKETTITKEEFEKLPESQREKETCYKCHGEGELIVEYD